VNIRQRLLIVISGWLICGALFMATLKAQQPPSADRAAPGPTSAFDQARSAVTLDGQTVFFVSNFKVYSSAMRAKRISGALKNAADDYRISTRALTLADDAISTDIVVGDQILFSIVDADAAVEGVDRRELGRQLLAKTSSAIDRYRRDRAPRNLLISSLYAVLATLAFIALMLFFLRMNRKLMVWVHDRARKLQVQSRQLVRADWALHVLTGIWGPIRLIIACGLVLGFLVFVLSLFPWTRPFSYEVLNYIVVPIRVMTKSIVPQIPGLMFIAVLAVIIRYLLRFIRFLFSEIERGRITIPGFYPDWSGPTFNIVRVMLVGFALVVAFPYIPGSDSLAFQGISVFLGVLLSLGYSSAVSNMVAGVLLTYMRAFKIGDVVTIGDSTGIVTAVSMLVTHVRTFKEEQITIPNSMVLSTHVTNFTRASRDEGLILHTSVKIGYDTPWRQVESLLLMAADRTPGLLHEPAPFVLQKELDDFYIRYELNVATRDPQRMARTYSELHANIQDAFNEYGVQIMTPHYEADRNVPTYVPREHWFATPAKVADRVEDKYEDQTARN
jgi:small-conductance mechanosensitive channel